MIRHVRALSHPSPPTPHPSSHLRCVFGCRTVGVQRTVTTRRVTFVVGYCGENTQRKSIFGVLGSSSSTLGGVGNLYSVSSNLPKKCTNYVVFPFFLSLSGKHDVSENHLTKMSAKRALKCVEPGEHM